MTEAGQLVRATTMMVAVVAGGAAGCAAIVGADFDVSARPVEPSVEYSARVEAPNGDTQLLGLSVAIEGDTALVGTSDADWIGQVLVMKRDAHPWHISGPPLTAGQYAKPNAQFGSSVALSHDSAIVGARGPNQPPPNQAAPAGKAYFFERDVADKWALVQSEFQAPDASDDDQFGTRVAIENDVAVVSAPGILYESKLPGSVYIYVRDSAGNWAWAQSLRPDPEAPGDNFGYEIALRGTTLVVSAPGDDVAGTDAGAVYFFERSGDTWIPAKEPTIRPAASDASRFRFGEGTIGFDQGLLMVPAPNAPSGEQVTAYGLDKTGTWIRESFNPAPGLSSRSSSVWRAAIRGTNAIVVGTSNDVGMGLLYERSAGTWNFVERLLDSRSTSKDVFGWTIAYDGSTACFGAIFFLNKAGAAYFFDLSQ